MANLSSFKSSPDAMANSVLQFQWDDTLFNVLSVSAIYCNLSGKILYANSQFLNELKLEKTQITGGNLSDVLNIIQNNSEVFPQLIRRLNNKEKFIDFPFNSFIRLKHTNKKFYIKGQAIGLYEKEKLARVLLLFRNIEAELTQEYIFNMALSRTKIFPWYFNLEDNKMTVDARWFSHLGIPTKDCTLSAGEFADIVHPDDRDTLLNALTQQISGTLIKDLFTYRLKRGDGNYEWFEEQSVYLGEVNGAPYRIVGVCHSIDEYKQTEAKLIEARNRAEESDRLKSAFLANMSHEIRTPLNAIVGFSNLLTSGDIALDEKEAREYGRIINTNSDQLLLLISDILDLSKIESNTMEFHFSKQSLNHLLKEVYESQVLNLPLAVELILHFPENDIQVTTDAMRLKQVLTNLISNAKKFTTKGSISLGYHLSEDGDQAILYVKDTGTGIPEDKQQLIFERFYKADIFQKGVGLGLSICKTIVANLGSRIEFYSKLNEGSCFTIYHPLNQ